MSARLLHALAVALAAALLVGCEGDKAGSGSVSEGGAARELPANHPPLGPASFHPDAGRGPLRFEKPAGWKEVPPSGMRLLDLRLPRVEGDAEDGVLTVVRAGGSVELNIDRWRGQFKGAPEEIVEKGMLPAAKLPVTYVEMRGHYAAAAMPGQSGAGTIDIANAVLLGAIIEGPEGTYFVKSWGPARTMDAHRDAFRALVESAKR